MLADRKAAHHPLRMPGGALLAGQALLHAHHPVRRHRRLRRRRCVSPPRSYPERTLRLNSVAPADANSERPVRSHRPLRRRYHVNPPCHLLLS